jgi:hypothetical protein
MLSLDLAVCLLLLFGLLQRTHLILSQNDSFLCHLRRQSFQAVLEGLQIVPQPDRAHAGG